MKRLYKNYYINTYSIICLLIFASHICSCGGNSLFEGEEEIPEKKPEQFYSVYKRTAVQIENYIKFTYDYNMDGQNLFPDGIKDLKLFIFNSNGHIIKCIEGNINDITTEGHLIKLDYEKTENGNHKLLVWATIEIGFSNYLIQQGNTYEDFFCTPNTKRDSNNNIFTNINYGSLFHGLVSSNLKVEDYDLNFIESSLTLKEIIRKYGSDYTLEDDKIIYSGFKETRKDTINIPLVKNNKYFRIVLQNLDSAPLEEDYFDISISNQHGKLTYNNTPIQEEAIYYSPYAISSQDNNFIAEFNLTRLMAENTGRLVVRSKISGRTIIDTPYYNYLWIAKEYEGKKMEKQEYLDRQDEYHLTLFLYNDDNLEKDPYDPTAIMRWSSNNLVINNWLDLKSSSI